MEILTKEAFNTELVKMGFDGRTHSWMETPKEGHKEIVITKVKPEIRNKKDGLGDSTVGVLTGDKIIVSVPDGEPKKFLVEDEILSGPSVTCN